MNYIELRVVVPGNTNLKAGDIIEVELPPYYYQDRAREIALDMYHSGKYIIHTIDHNIADGQYTMTLSLGRDVLGKLPVKEEYINV